MDYICWLRLKYILIFLVELSAIGKNKNSSMLWHKRLGHISRPNIEGLVGEDILPNLEFLVVALA